MAHPRRDDRFDERQRRVRRAWGTLQDSARPIGSRPAVIAVDAARCLRLAAVCLLGIAWNVPQADADAIVRTRAMSATTIAEYFVEPGSMRLELEIGLADLEAFRNLVPDFIHDRLGYERRSLSDRLDDFFGNDLVVVADDGEPLPGRVVSMTPGLRIRRDEITGESLPPIDGSEPESVVVATIEYRLPESPATITLYGSTLRPAPSIGFVLYHRGVAVNDFRYLSRRQRLVLDWDDPWYTRFENPALRRSYFAPMSGFLYIEPFEVRKEIIVRPIDLQHWVDLGLEGREAIPTAIQPLLMQRAAEFLRGRLPVTIDGRHIEPQLSRVNFLERTLRTSRVIDPPEELSVFSAVLGIIFTYPTTGLPEVVKMDWDLWNERVQVVPGAAVDQAGGLPSLLEPEFASLVWENFLKNPDLPSLVDVRRPPTPIERILARSRWGLLALALLATVALGVRVRRGFDRPAVALLMAMAVVLAAATSFAIGARATLSSERAGDVVEGILHNVYRAFDYRNEEQVYDVLGLSVDGDLLEEIYLETRRGLEVANQGGARARVKEIELTEVEVREAADGAFLARTSWNVFGSVGHWGHMHSRSNRYEAELEIAPRAGVWKLTRLDILEEVRL